MGEKISKIGGSVLEKIMDNKQTESCNFNKDLSSESLKLPKMTFLDRLNPAKLDFA